jgi:hypothetical protein
VAHVVREGSHLDEAAKRRHATEYLRVPASFAAGSQAQRGENPCCTGSASSTSSSSPGGADESVAFGSSGNGEPHCILRIPMLPPDVSRACSLNPNEDRYAVITR